MKKLDEEDRRFPALGIGGMGTGDRFDSAFDKLGWPKCAICQKPVEKLTRYENIAGGSVLGAIVFAAHCHGDVERIEVDELQFYRTLESGGTFSLDGLAFNRPKLPGGGIMLPEVASDECPVQVRPSVHSGAEDSALVEDASDPGARVPKGRTSDALRKGR